MEISEMPIHNIEWVNVKELKQNDYNPNVVLTQEMNLLKLSIMENGWIQPILITQDNIIIDGFHRATLCKIDKQLYELTDGKVPCVRMNLTEPQRMLLTIRINRAKGNHIAFKMSDVIHKLVNEYNIPTKVISKEIGATKEEINLLLQDNVFTMKKFNEDTKYSQSWVPQKTKNRK